MKNETNIMTGKEFYRLELLRLSQAAFERGDHHTARRLNIKAKQVKI